jgi:hypothetical protein
MARGDPMPSPWHWDAGDYLGRTVAVDVFFNTSTRAIINPGLTGTRDVGCLYQSIIIGKPLSGTEKTFPIPEGAFSVGRPQLANNGFATIDDVINANFTLGF